MIESLPAPYAVPRAHYIGRDKISDFEKTRSWLISLCTSALQRVECILDDPRRSAAEHLEAARLVSDFSILIRTLTTDVLKRRPKRTRRWHKKPKSAFGE